MSQNYFFTFIRNILYFFGLSVSFLAMVSFMFTPSAFSAGNIILTDPEAMTNLELDKKIVTLKFNPSKTLFESSQLVKTFALEENSTYQVKLENLKSQGALKFFDLGTNSESTTISTSENIPSNNEVNSLYKVTEVSFRTKMPNPKIAEYISTNPLDTNVRELNNSEKQRILEDSKEAKKAIKKQKEEEVEATKAKLEKDKRVEKSKQEQKAKRKEIQEKVKQGKTNEITVEDVYTLGDSGKDFGVEIIPPLNKGGSFEIKVDKNKVLNYKKDQTIVDSFVDLLTGVLKFGSTKADAFDAEFYNTNVFHATPKAHMGTAFDLFYGNTSNGSTIGMYGKHDGWNQKFYLYKDDTIRIAGKCLDLNGNNAYNGGKIQLWDCNGTNAQKWTYDTGGRIRLKASTGWCLDNDYGGWNTKLYLWQCTNNTERFRPSSFEMRLYARKYPGVGHTFVQIAKFDNYNNVIANTTYSLWPSWSGMDSDSNNSNTKYKEANDKAKTGDWGSRWVNRDDDLADGYDATQNADYRNSTAYWLKWLQSWEYDSIKDGGYLISPSWYVLIDNCTNYAIDLWLKYRGKNGYGYGFDNIKSIRNPQQLASIMVYDWWYGLGLD